MILKLPEKEESLSADSSCCWLLNIELTGKGLTGDGGSCQKRTRRVKKGPVTCISSDLI